MPKRKIKMFYLPLNQKVILGFIGFIMIVGFGVINFDNQQMIEKPVFKQEDKAYYRGPTDENRMALTINVAWGEEYLPQMLDTLDEYNVKATFFFIGRWVEKFPNLTKEIKKRGHELGNHGFKHLHPKKLSKEQLIDLIKENEKLIYETTDYKTNLFAPPYGEVDDRIVKVASEVGYKTIMWTIDTIDWQRPSSEVIFNRVINKAQKGGIVLMHPTKPTAKALAKIVKALKTDYELVTVSQLLK